MKAAYRHHRWTTLTCPPLTIADDTAGTINSQLLIHELMALADQRHLYRNADGSNIAFIMTVNDASGMRESLTRAGRADWHDHVPSAEDKANIAWAVLAPQTACRARSRGGPRAQERQAAGRVLEGALPPHASA